MENFYNSYTAEWSNSTFVFYLLIIISCYLFAKTKKKLCFSFNRKKISCSIGLLIPEIILIFVKGFSSSGRDLNSGYYLDFLSAKSMSLFRDQGVEKGYVFLNVLVNKLVHEYWIFIFIVSLLTIVPVFKVIKKYENRIDVSVAIFLYASIFYFPSFSLMRISLAASFGILAFDAMYEKKAIKSFIWILIAVLFHTSMICLIIPFIIIFLKKLNWKHISSISIIFLGLLFINRNSMQSLLFGRYSIYSLSSEGIGIEQLFYHIPIILLLIYQKKINIKPDSFFRLNFSYVITSLFLGMLQYLLPVLGRTYVAFIPLILVVAYSCKQICMVRQKLKYLLQFVILSYGIIRFYIYITQYYNVDDVMPYFNYFGWRI